VSGKNVPNEVFHKCSVTSGSRCRSEERASGRNLRLEIEYDGTNYCGWQVQNSHQHKSIQGAIEKTLQKILQEKIRLVASGRTDAGVHAFDQVANFKTRSDIPLKKLQTALNGLLPDDIAVIKIEEANPDFHSRFCAKSKVYRYTILNRPYPSPLLRKKVFFYRWPLDIKIMQKEARVLIGRHNFKCFQAADKKKRDAVRTIKRLKITRAKNLIYIEVEADGFLKNMVRNIAGTLMEIGRGKLPEGSLKKILLSKNRNLAGPTAPAKGLALVKVNY
jgi:tRNA pseudouridine38-40 synthase